MFSLLTTEFSATEIPLKEKVEDMRRQVLEAKLASRFDPASFKVTMLADDGNQIGMWAEKACVVGRAAPVHRPLCACRDSSLTLHPSPTPAATRT